MEKISGILPSNNRITSVDMKESGASRPGMPTFGRRAGTTAQEERSAQTTAMKAVSAHKNLMDARSKSAVQADVVKSISDGFFMKKPTVEEEIKVDPMMYEDVIVDGQVYGEPIHGTDSEENELAPVQVGLGSEIINEDEADIPLVGRYLNVEV